MKTKLLSFLQSIPPHKVTTYKHIADALHTHPRAVARILASNTQQDIYPCYKVISSDGSLGGYNLWTQEKIHRLQSDGIHIENDKIASQYIRKPIDNVEKNL